MSNAACYDDEKQKDKQQWKITEDLMTIVMGMIIGTTPLIIVQSSFTLEVALILFFLNNSIVIDDWWTTLRFTGKYDCNLKPGHTILITLIYENALIFLTIWLLAASYSAVPLEGYLLILLGINVLDVMWCQSVLSANPQLPDNDYLRTHAWLAGDVAGAFLFLFGFFFLHFAHVEPLVSALTFVALYVVGRFLDEVVISRALKQMVRRKK